MKNSRTNARLTRKKRIRAKVIGTPERPRLSVYRSLKNLSAQVINDAVGRTIASASLNDIKGAKLGVESARKLGKLIAERAKAVKVEKVVFDRSGYKYHGRVRALAEGAREGGLQF